MGRIPRTREFLEPFGMSSFRDTYAPQRQDREIYDYFLDMKRNASTRLGTVMKSGVADTEATEFPTAVT
jgi:hypothetical protein